MNHSSDLGVLYHDDVFCVNTFGESIPNLIESPELPMFVSSPPPALFLQNGLGNSSFPFDDIAENNNNNIPHEPFELENILNSNNDQERDTMSLFRLNEYQAFDIDPSHQQPISLAMPRIYSDICLSSSFIEYTSLPPICSSVIPTDVNPNIASISTSNGTEISPERNYSNSNSDQPRLLSGEQRHNVVKVDRRKHEIDTPKVDETKDTKGKTQQSQNGIYEIKVPFNVIITNHSSTPLNRKCRSKRLKCGYCDKCFATNYELKRHERVHTGERPFKCPLCPKAFRQKQHMLTHKKNIHGGGKSNLFKCDICHKQLKAKATLTRHIKYVHNFDRK